MAVCDHCTYRYSWDCDDGFSYSERGCENFELDFQTLTKRQQKAIRRILAREEDE